MSPATYGVAMVKSHKPGVQVEPMPTNRPPGGALEPPPSVQTVSVQQALWSQGELPGKPQSEKSPA